jgi:hypothetical protein
MSDHGMITGGDTVGFERLRRVGMLDFAPNRIVLDGNFAVVEVRR